MIPDEKADNLLRDIQGKPSILESQKGKRRPESGMERILLYIYEDYQVDGDRKRTLLHNTDQLVEALGNQALQFSNDPLSNSKCVHVTGTELQSSSDIWFTYRTLRITGMVSSPMSFFLILTTKEITYSL